MCEPTVIAMTAMAAAGGFQAYSQVQEGKTQAQQYRYLADQTDVQAMLAQRTADQNTTLAQDAAARDATQLKKNVRQTEGAQVVAEAEAGIGGSVTAADIASDTLDKAKLDELAIRFNADVQSWDQQNNARMTKWYLERQKGLYKFSAKQAKRAGQLKAVGTLLSTAASTASIGATAPNPSGLQGFKGTFSAPGGGTFRPSTPPAGY